MRFLRSAVIIAMTFGSVACFGLDSLFSKSPASPTPSSTESVRSYLGTWTAPVVTSYPSNQSCGNMQWKITSQNGSQITGDFQATCASGATLAGTVVATHSDTSIPWAASGNATQGSVSCPFSVSGTATFQGTSHMLVSYAGTVCSLPVSGSETITR